MAVIAFLEIGPLFSFVLISLNWIWILQEAAEDIKEETVVEEGAVVEVVAAVEVAEMVIGFAQTPGKFSFLRFCFVFGLGFPSVMDFVQLTSL